MTATPDFARRLRPRTETLAWGALLVTTEALAVLAYYAVADVQLTDPRFVVYPLVWINASLWAVARVRPPPSSQRRRWLAAGVGVAYFAALTYFGGVWTLAVPEAAPYLRVAWLPPGWGPAVLYANAGVAVAALPYKVVGYAALAYLVAATVLDAAGSALSGVVGLFSCVSCTWPILATVLSGVFGAGSAVAAVATSQPYGVSTLVFLSAVALLVWRPTR